MRKLISRGFTLIELLVVIAIIGILASIILVSLNGARGKARDSQRLANLAEAVKVILSDPNADSSTSFAGCTGSGGKASACTTPAGLSILVDPGTGGATQAACTTSSAASCEYGVTTAAGTNGTALTATFSDWKIITYLETGSGSFTTAGRVCVSSATSTPFSGGSC